jgi:sialic acid synthase SpsE
MRISGREIGEHAPPLIIAELGINHGGSLVVAKAMVDAAASAGCEIVKHQTHFVEDEMTVEAKQIVPPNASQSIWEIIDRCSLSRDDEIELKRHAESRGMIYISTPFSRAAADFLAEIDVPAFKIGSGECDHLPLIEHVAGFGKPVIMSTGMHSVDTIRNSVAILESSGVEYALLECTNVYPSPPEVISLKGIGSLGKAFPRAIIGFSDHSIGPEMAIAAVALGAHIIERHFTDSKYRQGPDIICSMDPHELRRLITSANDVHIAMRSEKHRKKDEEGVYKFARSSIVADRDIPAGTIITPEHIWPRRPGTGEIAADQFHSILGLRVITDVKRNTQIRWDFLEHVI